MCNNLNGLIIKAEDRGINSLTTSEKQKLEGMGISLADINKQVPKTIKAKSGNKKVKPQDEKLGQLSAMFAQLETERALYDGSDNEDSDNDIEEVINLNDRNFSQIDSSKLTYKQAKKMRNWQVKYRKTLVNFEKIIPRFEKFIKLTSDRQHPFYSEGKFIHDFLQDLDNKITGWTDNDAKFFERYFTEEMPHFAIEMKFDHRSYKPICCEYGCNEDFYLPCRCAENEINFGKKVFEIKKSDGAKNVDIGIRQVFDMLRDDIVKFGCQAFKDESLKYSPVDNERV